MLCLRSGAAVKTVIEIKVVHQNHNKIGTTTTTTTMMTTISMTSSALLVCYSSMHMATTYTQTAEEYGTV
jgi:hypothetical protein